MRNILDAKLRRVSKRYTMRDLEKLSRIIFHLVVACGVIAHFAL